MEAVHKLLILNKALQVIAVLAWYASAVHWKAEEGPRMLSLEMANLVLSSLVATLCAATPFQWSLAIPMFVFGQLLNFSVYRAIGKVGVYYGFKLGMEVPWVTGFPFNVVRHPQYTGATLSWWAAIILMAEGPGLIESGLFGLAAAVLATCVPPVKACMASLSCTFICTFTGTQHGARGTEGLSWRVTWPPQRDRQWLLVGWVRYYVMSLVESDQL